MLPVRKHSRKRDAILQCLRETTEHPSAEQIYARLKPEIPDLSLGTVYRNLAQFRRENTVVSVGTVGGQERFDGNTTPHDHFICNRCGAVLDLAPLTLPDGALRQVQEQIGAEISGFRLNYFGLCSRCKTAEDKSLF